MDLKFDKVYEFTSVTMTVWRWDSWCQANLEACTGTYQRLGGLSIRVSTTESNHGYTESDHSYVECGTVPEYTAPTLHAGIIPQPIVKSVTCEGTVGDKITLYQTRTGAKVMISEIEIERASEWCCCGYTTVHCTTKI